MINLFADKTTIILRKMLKNPDRSWVIKDFIKQNDKEFGIGQGRIAKALNEMDRIGYIEREIKGAKSKAFLTNPEILINDWLKLYTFEKNQKHSLYSHDKNIIKKIKKYLKENKIQHAFTLHTAANLYTSYVRTQDVYVYINIKDLVKDTIEFRQRLDLKQLVSGGNIHLIKPYYKNSLFWDTQKIKGYNTVSNLQLYLDLYNFHPRGKEHALYFKESLQMKGILF